MNETSPFLEVVGLEKVISSCREFSLNSQLTKIYDERNKLYVIPIWHRRSISFDV
ncbi:MAG: hypothetical protein ISS01_03360, partial [Nanoarchaeota archaeon]|nr:hypothetical protein [Nanoarchaeota archaeon]